MTITSARWLSRSFRDDLRSGVSREMKLERLLKQLLGYTCSTGIYSHRFGCALSKWIINHVNHHMSHESSIQVLKSTSPKMWSYVTREIGKHNWPERAKTSTFCMISCASREEAFFKIKGIPQADYQSWNSARHCFDFHPKNNNTQPENVE